MTRKVLTVFVLAAAIAVTAISVRASDPVGAYCIVDKVVLEPNDLEPAAVQVWGAFSFAIKRDATGNQPWPSGAFGDQRLGDVYGPVEKGYVYYACPRGKETACRAEWMDLKSVAGKHEVVGFGQRWTMTGRVRPATEKPAAPDVYTLNIGTIKFGSYSPTGSSQLPQYAGLVQALQAAARVK